MPTSFRPVTSHAQRTGNAPCWSLASWIAPLSSRPPRLVEGLPRRTGPVTSPSPAFTAPCSPWGCRRGSLTLQALHDLCSSVSHSVFADLISSRHASQGACMLLLLIPVGKPLIPKAPHLVLGSLFYLSWLILEHPQGLLPPPTSILHVGATVRSSTPFSPHDFARALICITHP